LQKNGNWHLLNISFSKENVIPYLISVRPGAIEMLVKLKKDFELILFSASEEIYMRAVV
jgi:TFIIF-interacting CTD phosphatase-like protein